MILARISSIIDLFNEQLGRAISWMTLALVVVQFAIVLFHYVFREGSIFLQESLLYMHSLIFLGAAGYTLLHNGHVRVDVFYRDLPEKIKAWINLIGCLIFLFPVMGLIGWMSWPYVTDSWAALEGSVESSGIQAVYLLKSMILLFVAGVVLQGLSLCLHSLMILSGEEHFNEEEQDVL